MPPEKCPECGYLLRGLPAVGRCPECGWAYDGEQIVLYGHRPGEGRRSPALTVSRARWFWATLLLSLALGAALWLVSGLAVATIGTVSVGGFGVASYYAATRIDARRRRTQVRLSADGFAVRDQPGPVKVTPWRLAKTATLAWDPEPRPGWLAVALETDEDPEKHGRLRRGLARGVKLLNTASGGPERVDVELGPDAARRAIEQVEQWLKAADKTLTVPPATRQRLGLITEAVVVGDAVEQADV